MFRIKICGITTVADAQFAAQAGADAVGLNFYARSKRHVERKAAQCIATAVREQVALVGVFVNSSAMEVNECVNQLGLNWVQLHGDEPPDYLAHLTDRVRVLRVYRMGPQGTEPLVADLGACQQSGRCPDALLIDAATPGEYGGTGTTVDWARLSQLSQQILTRCNLDLPLVLAGGLTAENVATAIRAARPHGVDVASGVESVPGVKDPAKVRLFVSEARQALTTASREHP